MTQSLLLKIQAVTPYLKHRRASCWLHPLTLGMAVLPQHPAGRHIFIFPSRDRCQLGVSDMQDPHSFSLFPLGLSQMSRGSEESWQDTCGKLAKFMEKQATTNGGGSHGEE